MSIKNAELIDLIASNSVKLTEAQMREAEGLYQMIGEEEKSAQQVGDLVKEQKITTVYDLKVKLGVAKEKESDTLADLPEAAL